MNFEKISIAVVDDHKLFRHAIINYLSNYKSPYEIHIAFQGENGNDILQKMSHSPVDILVTDLFMDGMDGIKSIKQLRNKLPNQKILVLSMCTDMMTINEIVNEGINGYISKADEIEMVPQAIIAIYNDRIFQSRIMTDALYFSKIQTNGSTKTKMKLFTERETQLLQLLWDEKSNKEIADELFLGIRSIEKIIQEMKVKANTTSTIGLLKYCLQHKIIKH